MGNSARFNSSRPPTGRGVMRGSWPSLGSESSMAFVLSERKQQRRPLLLFLVLRFRAEVMSKKGEPAKRFMENFVPQAAVLPRKTCPEPRQNVPRTAVLQCLKPRQKVPRTA